MTLIRQFALSIALTLPIGLACAAGIEGTYAVSGVDVQGDKDVGMLTISANGALFRLV